MENVLIYERVLAAHARAGQHFTRRWKYEKNAIKTLGPNFSSKYIKYHNTFFHVRFHKFLGGNKNILGASSHPNSNALAKGTKV